jgi:mono/diheme cytochrome c family protein
VSGAARVAAVFLVIGSLAAGCGGAKTAPAPASPPAQAVAPAAVPGAAPSSAAPDIAAGPSTLDSVYTADQAARGKDVYLGSCRSCHTPASHTGATFEKRWRGKHLSDLYTYVATKMPGNDPGSLSPDAVADVVAYLLQLNAMPAGAQEIYPEADSLRKFRIDVSTRK